MQPDQKAHRTENLNERGPSWFFTVGLILLAVVLGIITTRFFLVASLLSLLSWAIVGLMLGAFSPSRRDARRSGVIYGFFLVVSFMLAGRVGGVAGLFLFGFLTFGLAIFGALCAVALGVVGYWLREQIKNHFR